MDVNIATFENSSIHGKKNQQLIKVSSQSADKDDKAAAKVAGEFEALFVGQMLKSMRGDSKGDSLTNGGKGGEIFRSLLDQEYANAVSESGSLGLAKIITKELVKVDRVEQADTKNHKTTVNEEGRGMHYEN